MRLGPEVGRGEGRHLRRRMFAIVDRSGLLPDRRPVARFDPRAGSAVLHFSVIE